MSNDEIIQIVKEITIAKVSNSSYKPEEVVNFMQVIYDKLIELNNSGKN